MCYVYNVYVCMYMYIYIYIHIERERDAYALALAHCQARRLPGLPGARLNTQKRASKKTKRTNQILADKLNNYTIMEVMLKRLSIDIAIMYRL